MPGRAALSKPFSIPGGLGRDVDIAIVDGYTDEPAALGVPPYIAPLPRYLAGAAWTAGCEGVLYSTIDEVRRVSRKGAPPKGPRPRGKDRDRDLLAMPGGDRYDLLVLLGGAVVPGNYLRGRPASARELSEIARSFPGPTILVGPVARWGWTSGEKMTQAHFEAFDHVATRDGDAYLHDLLGGEEEPMQRFRTREEWASWSVEGADIVSSSREMPHPLIVEIETYRGCIRHAFGGCSFCTTVRDIAPVFREPSEIAKEVRALDRLGVVSYRLGGQSCIYSYKALGVGEEESPVPDPHALRSLLEGIRRAAPSLEVLHVDNANPAVIADHPEEAEMVTQLIIEYCTGGNLVALGLESADPAVQQANNLNATREQCMEAIRAINRWGRYGTDTGLPALLPGINFLGGLQGETPETFELNMAFLEQVLDEGLLLRRINIRRVAPVCGQVEVKHDQRAFRKFKLQVRAEIDLPNLQALLPYAAPMRRVWTELHDGNTTFGRQIGSYPLLVGIPAKLELGTFLDVRVVGYGMRSVTGVPDPLDIDSCPMSLLSAVPGIGKKRAARIVRARPFEDEEALRSALDDPRAADALLPLVDL
jgi:radical SAM superfamily enzyme with C-terminal helix-hairpin-helix motif